MSVTLQIKKLNDLATIPTKGSPKSAGYDLYSIERYTLKPLERKLFKTGLSMAIPYGMYGRIAPRSGLAFKNGLDVLAGVIDEDYRGEVGVVLINLGQEELNLPLVKDGKEVPIAQIIFEFYNNVQISVVDNLNETERGQGGFGSTNEIKISATHSQTESELIKLRSKVPVVESTDAAARKFDDKSPYHDIGKSNILDKWKEAGAATPTQPKYENLVREREKQII